MNITIDEMYQCLRQWGFWQRTAHRQNLDAAITQYDSSFIQTNCAVLPVYRDTQSEELDSIISNYLTTEYKDTLTLTFAEQHTIPVAAAIMDLSETTFKAKRREAIGILVGIKIIKK